MIVNKKNKLEDFSKMDLDNFEKMLMNSDRGAKVLLINAGITQAMKQRF